MHEYSLVELTYKLLLGAHTYCYVWQVGEVDLKQELGWAGLPQDAPALNDVPGVIENVMSTVADFLGVRYRYGQSGEHVLNVSSVQSYASYISIYICVYFRIMPDDIVLNIY